MSQNIDLGGNTIVCEDIKVGATAPGQAGTSLSSTELLYLDGLTTGTVTASKAVVVDANKDIGTFRHVTLSGNLVTGSTTLSEAELGVLDSASNANSATGKAAILGTSGAVTFAGAVTPTGGVAAAGGFSVKPYSMHTGGIPAQVSTDGTDSTPSTTETYYAHVFVGANTSVTGISVFNGSATGSGNITAYLVDSTGAQVAGALTASTAISGTDAYQRIPFTPSPVTVKGPASYYVVTQYNNTSTRFNTHTFGDFPAAKVTSTTYGTLPAITPATTFTTALGPIASLY